MSLPFDLHFESGLILLLVGLLFFKDEIMPFIKYGVSKFTGKQFDESQTPATKKQMETLSNYYNHDTTELLKSIDANIVKMHSALEKVEDAVRELKQQHSEWEKYGIPTRPPKS
jgi:hypothetical protein